MSTAWLGCIWDVGGSSWLQHWRRGAGDTKSLSYKPSQTQDPVTAPQTVGGACWSMHPNMRSEICPLGWVPTEV